MDRSIRSQFFYSLGLLLAVSIGPTKAASSPDENARGKRIFNGEEALQGKITGHSSNLPASLGRCASCHASVVPPRLEAQLEARAAPLLDHTSLLEKQARRGGPPSAYDKNSFCQALRTGIDPQYIILTRTMPRFEVDEAQCNALWVYLTRERGQYESR